MPTIQNRRATAAQWTAANPVLAAGEIGFEFDMNALKVGDGLTAWVDLPYLSDESLKLLVESGRLSEAALNDTYGAEVMQEVITAEAESPTGVIARRGGKTKSDGQNIRHFRRPTLAVERMWPNNLIDHQIVYVDETAREAYSVGQDQRFRKATWASTEEEASNWGDEGGDMERHHQHQGIRACRA